MNLTAEQNNKLEQYVVILQKWQKTINLVSKSTIDDIWERHIEDSAQLSPLIKKNLNILDMGSGGGFPGMVLAIIRPDLNITLVESDSRKCAFLQSVSRETSTVVSIINERIETINLTSPPDIISARALSSIDNLLNYSWPHIKTNPALKCIFLKGEKADLEIEDAQKSFNFNYNTIRSVTNSQAKIIEITNVSRET